MTREELLEQKAKIEKALLRGEAVIEFEGRRVEFSSHDDLMSKLDWINSQIEIIDSGGANGSFARVRYVSSTKDL